MGVLKVMFDIPNPKSTILSMFIVCCLRIQENEWKNVVNPRVNHPQHRCIVGPAFICDDVQWPSSSWFVNRLFFSLKLDQTWQTPLSAIQNGCFPLPACMTKGYLSGLAAKKTSVIGANHWYKLDWSESAFSGSKLSRNVSFWVNTKHEQKPKIEILALGLNMDPVFPIHQYNINDYSITFNRNHHGSKSHGGTEAPSTSFSRPGGHINV